MKIEINTDNAWAIINYYLTEEIDGFRVRKEIKIPDDIDEAILKILRDELENALRRSVFSRSKPRSQTGNWHHREG